MTVAQADSKLWRTLRAVGRVVDGAGVMLVVGGVWVYRVTLGPLLGGRCRFTPSCSEYCVQAVRRYGTLRGVAKTLWRLARCHPFHPGGYDPP